MVQEIVTEGDGTRKSDTKSFYLEAALHLALPRTPLTESAAVIDIHETRNSN